MTIITKTVMVMRIELMAFRILVIISFAHFQTRQD